MAKKERIGIVGGRFDPVRSSHIHAALTLLDSGSVDRVLLLLSGEGALISAEDRWKMLVAACAAYESLVPVLFKSTAGSLSFEEVSLMNRQGRIWCFWTFL